MIYIEGKNGLILCQYLTKDTGLNNDFYLRFNAKEENVIKGLSFKTQAEATNAYIYVSNAIKKGFVIVSSDEIRKQALITQTPVDQEDPKKPIIIEKPVEVKPAVPVPPGGDAW